MQNIWNKDYFDQLDQPKAPPSSRLSMLADQFWAKATFLLGKGVK